MTDSLDVAVCTADQLSQGSTIKKTKGLSLEMSIHLHTHVVNSMLAYPLYEAGIEDVKQASRNAVPIRRSKTTYMPSSG